VAVINCTFVANRGLMRAGGVFNNSGATTLTNCILWGNIRMGEMCDEWAQASGARYPAANHCCLEGWMGILGGSGNLGDDPLFVDADGSDNVAGTPDDDLRLSGNSPCLDRGDNAAVPPEAATDLAGRPRILNGIVDLGAYEFDPGTSPQTP
jgi:hypothetical protein